MTRLFGGSKISWDSIQYIPRNMHTVFALLCFVVVIHWLIFPYPSGLLHWHCGNLTIAPVPAKQSWWIWINASCEFIMNDCITTTKQSTTKPCAYFLGYTVCWVQREQDLWSCCWCYITNFCTEARPVDAIYKTQVDSNERDLSKNTLQTTQIWNHNNCSIVISKTSNGPPVKDIHWRRC